MLGSAFGLYIALLPLHPTTDVVQPLSVAVKVQYILGSVLFIAGGSLFQQDDYLSGSTLWVVGCVFFVTGAVTAFVLTFNALAPLANDDQPDD